MHASNSVQRRPRSAAAAVAALAVAAALLAGGTAAAQAPNSRIAGGDRFETAQQIALDGREQADVAIVASGANFADALSGSYLAGQLDAPILLTDPGTVPPSLRSGLNALDAQQVVLLGGSQAISAEVESELAESYSVTRIFGASRFATAAAAAEHGSEAGVVGDIDGQRAAILVGGGEFPDALSAGPGAAAGELPLLLTSSEQLNEETAAAIEDLEIELVVIVGGSAAVSPTVGAQLQGMDVEVQRVAGPERTSTATEFATYAQENLGITFDEVTLARGDDFPDALAGGPHAGMRRSPILLTVSRDLGETSGESELGPATLSFLGDNCDAISLVVAYGGTAAISEGGVETASTEADCESDGGDSGGDEENGGDDPGLPPGEEEESSGSGDEEEEESPV